MRHRESEIQRALIKWWGYAHKSLGVPDERLLFAIPNGGRRSKITAAIMKGEGVRAGAPDLFLAVPRGGWHGLFLELKQPDGSLTALQRSFMKAAHDQRYSTVLSWSLDDAVSAVIGYLGQS